jgi:CDGSH-type Zn-finger protein
MSTRSADGPAASVTVYPDGPLVLRGDFELRGLDGEPIDTARTIALCRCGRSALKPLCDGSHKNARVAVADRSD